MKNKLIHKYKDHEGHNIKVIEVQDPLKLKFKPFDGQWQLIYDEETPIIASGHFSYGKQVTRACQTIPGFDDVDIISIQCCWAHEPNTIYIIHWGFAEQDSGRVATLFEPFIEKADLIIGKNNHNFDDKKYLTVRLFNKLSGMPEFLDKVEDLQRLTRKYLHLPSHSLDYISKKIGEGGKIKMEMEDWIKISIGGRLKKVQNKLGKTAAKFVARAIFKIKDLDSYIEAALISYDKMTGKYGAKDVIDTVRFWNMSKHHFKQKNAHKTVIPNKAAQDVDHSHLCCVRSDCQSTKIVPVGGLTVGGKQKWYCKEHKGFAGYAFVKKNGTYGRMTQT